MTSSSNSDRVAVITGASSGIGEATARTLATAGYRVALLARRADRIQALADELGDGALAVEADVTDRDAVVAAARRVQDELGGADVLVNNAGVMLLGPFTSAVIARWCGCLRRFSGFSFGLTVGRWFAPFRRGRLWLPSSRAGSAPARSGSRVRRRR